jgi:hypothetical protein
MGPLSVGYLGLAALGVIYPDATAAGHGWFTDTSTTAAPPFGEIDLLTLVAHEVGRLFGLMDGNGTARMASTLTAGVRILPDAGDLPAPHTTLTLSAKTAGRPAVDLWQPVPRTVDEDSTIGLLLAATEPTSMSEKDDMPTAARTEMTPALGLAGTLAVPPGALISSTAGQEQTTESVISKLFRGPHRDRSRGPFSAGRCE